MCTPVARLATIIPHLFGSLTIRAIGGAPYLGGLSYVLISKGGRGHVCMYVT